MNPMNLNKCTKLPTQPESSTWYRAIQPQHWNTAIQTSHTTNFATRYSIGPRASTPFQILYLAYDQIVALFEVKAVLGSPYGQNQPSPRKHWTIVSVITSLQAVVDLTDVNVQKTLAATCQHITGDWHGYQFRSSASTIPAPLGIAPTQDLGAELFAVPNLEGFISVSARVPDKPILAIFPTKLRKGSYVEFNDQSNGRTHRIDGS